MEGTIKFSDYYNLTREYLDYKREIYESLLEFEETLFGYGINLLCKGKWKEWSEKNEEGFEYHFREDILYEGNDTNVNNILDLRQEVEKLIKFFEENT